MKISFIESFRSASGKKDEKFRRSFYVFLVSLVTSVIIWFTVKLSNEYNTVISMPVKFSQLPMNMTLTSVSDSLLKVEVVDKGSVLFKLMHLQKPKPANISLRFTGFYLDNGVFHGIVVPSLYINDIEREHGLLGKINSISPDTIYLTAERVKSRKVPVTATYDLTYEKHFQGYGNIVLEPDCVMVKGPGQMIDRLDSVSLGMISSHNMNQNMSINKGFPKDSAYRLFTFNPDQVKITLPVEKYTEAEIEVPVQAINTNNLNIKTFPDKVKVIYTVALKDYAMVEPDMLTITADFSGVNPNQENKVRLRPEKAPLFIRINKIEPERVEFIIVK